MAFLDLARLLLGQRSERGAEVSTQLVVQCFAPVLCDEDAVVFAAVLRMA
jgi:hypothetical protein